MHPDETYTPFPKNSGDSTDWVFFLPKSIQTGSLGLVVTTINEADVQSASVIINKNNAQVQDV